MSKQPSIWVLADPRPGTANQAIGVAETLSRPFTIKTLKYNILSSIPNPILDMFTNLIGDYKCLKNSDDFSPPWPDMIISSGRRAFFIASRIKRRYRPDCKIVQIMNPHWRCDDCDVLAIPYHDQLAATAPNIVRTMGNPHRLTDLRLQSGAQKFAPLWQNLTGHKIAVLLGGPLRHGGLTANAAIALLRAADECARATRSSLLISTSRRTPRAAISQIADIITSPYYLYDWAFGGENPYDGILACADAVIVSGDSTSMMTESCFTQKPVYIFTPPNFAPGKYKKLADGLITHGYARPFTANIDFNAPSRRLNPNAAIAEKIMGLIS